MQKVRLTVKMPDGEHRLRRDLDFWTLSELAHELEDEVARLRLQNDIQAARIKTLELDIKYLTMGGKRECTVR